MFKRFGFLQSNSLTTLLQTVLFVTTLICGSALARGASDWRIALIPASNDKNQTVRLATGQTQMLTVMLQASETVQNAKAMHRVELTFNLPPDVQFVSTSGGYEVIDVEQTKAANGRTQLKLTLNVPNNRLAGKPGQRLLSEWRSHSVFISMPVSIDAASSYIRATLRSGDNEVHERWPLELFTWQSVADRRPKLTTIGLWDYSYNRAGDASDGIGQFLASAGVNFVEKADGTFHAGMKANGILTGGNAHHSLFYSNEFVDYDVHGKPMPGQFACPQCVIDAPQDATIPGVAAMVDFARRYDGLATYDYEPGSHVGFCPKSIAAFKQKHDISDEAFDRLQAYMVKHGSKTYQTDDAEIAALYRQWVSFRSWQTSQYVRRIQEAVRAQDPNVRIALTPNVGYDEDGLSTLGYGYNAAAFSPYVDIIMPQIYVGYGGAGAKLTMNFTRHWRNAIDKQNLTTKLWPILLIRYAGASVYNAPERMRQQILGSLAEGAQGFLLYYPSNMDAAYWQTLAKTTEEITSYEAFYHHGRRVDEQFKLVDMPQGQVEIARYPAHKLPVENPQWAFTAHEHDGQVLLTLLNLEEQNDVLFTVELPHGMSVVQSANVEAAGDGRWLVGPRDVGFVVLSPQAASVK